MAVMEMVVQCLYESQVTINRWNYISSGEPASRTLSSLLSEGFGCLQEAGGAFPADSIMDAWQNIASDRVLFVQWSARDVYSATDFFTSPFAPSTVGENDGGDSASPALAYGFRTNRTRTDIRRATKRFAGVAENYLVDGGNIDVASLTGLQTLADAMGEVLSVDDEGNTVTFSPAVVSKEKYIVPSSGNEAYRYYATEAEQLEHVMTGIIWAPYTTVRTQSSRQYGRGV